MEKIRFLAMVTSRLTCWLVAVGAFSILLTAPSPETISVAGAEEKDKQASISEFRAWARYKAVRLTWEARISETEKLTFEIYRSMVRPDGEYSLVASIQGTPEVERYEYVDKTPPVEENYFYKIEIPETREAFGPLQVRPPFSAPST